MKKNCYKMRNSMKNNNLFKMNKDVKILSLISAKCMKKLISMGYLIEVNSLSSKQDKDLKKILNS